MAMKAGDAQLLDEAEAVVENAEIAALDEIGALPDGIPGPYSTQGEYWLAGTPHQADFSGTTPEEPVIVSPISPSVPWPAAAAT